MMIAVADSMLRNLWQNLIKKALSVMIIIILHSKQQTFKRYAKKIQNNSKIFPKNKENTMTLNY